MGKKQKRVQQKNSLATSHSPDSLPDQIQPRLITQQISPETRAQHDNSDARVANHSFADDLYPSLNRGAHISILTITQTVISHLLKLMPINIMLHIRHTTK